MKSIVVYTYIVFVLVRMGLSVHAVVFGAPTLTSFSILHIILLYLRALCATGCSAASYDLYDLPCSVTDLLFSEHQCLQQRAQEGTKLY